MIDIDCSNLTGVLTRIASELCLIRETMQMNRRDAISASRVPAVAIDTKCSKEELAELAEMIKQMNERV